MANKFKIGDKVELQHGCVYEFDTKQTNFYKDGVIYLGYNSKKKRYYYDFFPDWKGKTAEVIKLPRNNDCTYDVRLDSGEGTAGRYEYELKLIKNED